MYQKAIAKQYENLVASLLKQRGWSICAKNFRHIGFEIDIIGSRGDQLVAFEVKYRKKFKECFEEVEQLIPYKKWRALRRGLKFYTYLYAKKEPRLACELVIVFPTATGLKLKRFGLDQNYASLDLD